jgi:hypothetical protein
MRALVEGERTDGRVIEWGIVIAAELIAGAVGVALGALALLGMGGATVLILAVLIYGANFLFSSMVSLQPGWQGLGGLAIYLMGLLAGGGLHPLTLVLLAMAVLGVVGLFSGGLTGRRILGTAYRRFETARVEMDL